VSLLYVMVALRVPSRVPAYLASAFQFCQSLQHHTGGASAHMILTTIGLLYTVEMARHMNY